MGNANLKKKPSRQYTKSISIENLDSNWTSDKVKFTPKKPSSTHATTETRGQCRNEKISKENGSND